MRLSKCTSDIYAISNIRGCLIRGFNLNKLGIYVYIYNTNMMLCMYIIYTSTYIYIHTYILYRYILYSIYINTLYKYMSLCISYIYVCTYTVYMGYLHRVTWGYQRSHSDRSGASSSFRIWSATSWTQGGHLVNNKISIIVWMYNI